MKKSLNFLKKAVKWYFEKTADSIYMCLSGMIPMNYVNNKNNAA